MDLLLGAKSTKPGSKATSKRGATTSSGRPARVPVGALHLINESDQLGGAGYVAVCGESGLMSIDGSWEDDFSNDRCEVCTEQQWVISFDAMQAELLK